SHSRCRGSTRSTPAAVPPAAIAAGARPLWTGRSGPVPAIAASRLTGLVVAMRSGSQRRGGTPAGSRSFASNHGVIANPGDLAAASRPRPGQLLKPNLPRLAKVAALEDIP